MRFMNPSTFFRSVPLALLLAMSVSAAQAGKPQWEEERGHGKSDKHQQKEDRKHRDDRRDDDRRAGDVRVLAGSPGLSVQIQIGGYFNDNQRQAARAYYEPRFRAGNCPPGLAKKGNGCQPPGQAKRWQRGQPLPRDVVYYPVPSSVQVQLGTPPAGYKFVRVATDILLIAVGTSMVVDAIEDLGRL